MLSHFADARVPVTQTQATADPALEEPVSWKTEVSLRHFVQTLLTQASIDKPVYMGEWGLFLNQPDMWHDVALPALFSRDHDHLAALPASWRMNINYRSNVRWGSPGSRTNLHCDAYFASSWLAVLRGRKRVVFFPRTTTPGWQGSKPSPLGHFHTRHIHHMNRAVFRMLSTESEQAPTQGPEQGQPQVASIPDITDIADIDVERVWIGEVGAGDFLYLPPRWYHAVLNVETTFSIGGFGLNRHTAHTLSEYFRYIGDNHAQRLIALIFDQRGPRTWTRTTIGQRILHHPVVVRLARALFNIPS